jgi:hypothetical protein
MPWEFFGLDFEDVAVVRVPLGKMRTTMGRRAGMLTQMIPRLHSMTDRFSVGTLWTVIVSCSTIFGDGGALSYKGRRELVRCVGMQFERYPPHRHQRLRRIGHIGLYVAFVACLDKAVRLVDFFVWFGI